MAEETKRAAAAGSRSRVRTMKSKDKDAPKRPHSAYMFYANENRSKIREANPGLKSPEIGKQLATEWQRLSPAEQRPYEEKAAKDKERYETQMAAYKKQG
ncbi:hypothetical protein [Streptomyces klenkii]|uniref:hypothetical protein n=1 Tax=Streptomyces klenkii TaxID=1420899 RepID=UPI003440E2A1